MKNTDGQFLEWNVKTKTLVLAIESFTLGIDNVVDVYSGAFNTQVYNIPMLAISQVEMLV